MATTITNKLTTIPNFFKEFVVECDDEKEYAGEVFSLYEDARDAVLNVFDSEGIVWVNDFTGEEPWVDACGIFFHDLAKYNFVGESDILGEFVAEDIKYAEEAEKEYMAYAM